MGFFDWLGTKISDGAKFLGEKIPFLKPIVSTVRDIANFSKPLTSAFGFGGINDLISKGADMFLNNSSKIENGLEAVSNVGKKKDYTNFAKLALDNANAIKNSFGNVGSLGMKS